MYDTVLVPTDGSSAAELAGDYGCRLARAFDATVHVLYVREEPLLGDDEDDPAERAVSAVVDVAVERDLNATTAVLEPEDGIHDAIVEYAETNDVDLIAMGTHGRSGLSRFLLGSVAEQTLRESTVPVVTVHEDTDVRRAFDRILLPTDGSTSSVAAVDHAVELASMVDARIHAVHVSDEHDLDDTMVTFDTTDPDDTTGVEAIDEILTRAREAGLESVDVSIPDGRVDQAILAVAAEHDADAIVMGTRGRTGLRRYILGSTTDRVVRFARVPVFAVGVPRVAQTTVEFLDYQALDERGWSVSDDDLFEKASGADLSSEEYGTFEVERDEYVLEAAETAGRDWPFYCRAGGCVNCAAILVDGEVTMDVQRSLSDEEVAEENLCLTCVATPASESISLIYNAKHLDRLRDRLM